MILDNFPTILWINLERSIGRRKYMEKLLSEYHLKNIRIDAIDGKIKKTLLSICLPNLKQSALVNACTCSHLKALKYFIQNMTDDKIIIFEDDVSFDFLPLIPFDWETLVKNFPKEFDVIQLSICTNASTIVKPYLVKTDYKSYHFGAVAYLITRNAAKKILAKYWPTDKIDLSDKPYCTADSIISTTGSTYSIPFFTYMTTDSTIHLNHLCLHKRSKNEQTKMWQEIRSGIFHPESYFAKFEKN